MRFLTEIQWIKEYPRRMGTKYYTRFLLQTADEDSVDEYSGVVELHSTRSGVMEPREIEELLAKSFDLDAADQVRLLNWAPLQ